ncbi:MAG TPA: hypothetical protein VFD04_23690 [Actinomycetes bacterium]|jgi:hypothetical protein|nr:hypothetical protein [Actinomycetes bacterium]
MARDLAKEAGALESAAGKIRAAADDLDARKRMAVAQVQSTPWLGAAAQAAGRVAADVEAALTRHVANMRMVADKVAQASQRHDAADTEAGQLVAKVGGQLHL